MEKTNWLDTIKSEIMEITETSAYEYWKPITGYTKPYFNHRLEHVKQVEIEAKRLMDIYGGDEEIMLAAVWLHDRYKPQFEGANHGAKAADWIVENLASTGFPADKVSAVEYAVRNHQGLEISGLDTLEAKILWDADKISHIGSSFLVDMMYLNMMNIETITIDKIVPFLKEYMEGEPDLALEKRYYFKESIELYKEKRTITNMFINALIHRL
jgi:Predicted HD superfamily hydrolase